MDRTPPIGCLALALAAVGGGGCGSHNIRGTALEIERDSAAVVATAGKVLSTEPVTVGDFEYRATNGGLESRWPPVSVEVTVSVKNAGAHRARLDALSGNCAVRIRIYSWDDLARAAKQGAQIRPVFDAAQPGYSCYVPVLHRMLAVGEVTTLRSPGGGPGLDLAAGRYALTGVVTVIPPQDSLRRHGVHLIEVPAGTIRVGQPYD